MLGRAGLPPNPFTANSPSSPGDTVTAQEEDIWRFLREKLDIHSKNALYIEAFTHSANPNAEPKPRTNGNLAYLGDSIINFVFGDYCYKKFHPEGTKGMMSKRSNAMRSDSYLSKLAQKLWEDYPDIIISDNPPRSKKGLATMRAKALEALFGAIYLDQGFEKACALAEKHLLGL